MTFPFAKERLRILHARNASDVLACQKLRHRCFRGAEGVDSDIFDDRCRHLMITDCSGALVATARYQIFSSGRETNMSYAAQSYDMVGLSRVDARMLELGRFCVARHMADVDVLRMAWAALTRIVDAEGIRYLFGCASFQGTDPAPYGMVFRHLACDHQGPDDLRPKSRGAQMIPLAEVDDTGAEPMPRLLRSYLTMGGWVGAEATIDRDMQTMHVFTCLDVQSVPPSRARALRALAEGIALA